MSQLPIEVKRIVVGLVRSLARGRAVDLIWWEPSQDSLTLYVEGHLEDGGASRTSHSFDRNALERFSKRAGQAELRDQMRRIVAPFARRSAPKVGGAAQKIGVPTPPLRPLRQEAMQRKRNGRRSLPSQPRVKSV